MAATLLLSWIPLLVVAGCGGYVLGPRRGLVFGIVCTVVFTSLCAATAGAQITHDLALALLVAGGGLGIIVASGCGRRFNVARFSPAGPTCASDEDDDAVYGVTGDAAARIGAAIAHFDEWLAQHRDDPDPWPAFDEHLRTMLFVCCGATHVRPLRLDATGEALCPLQPPDVGDEERHLPARRGVTGFVMTTGRSYVQGDPLDGEFLHVLTERERAPDWCFAVRQGGRRLGVVTVGSLPATECFHRERLRVVELLVGQFWRAVSEASLIRSATLDDAVSGFLVRPAFLDVADRALTRSYEDTEPCALVVVAIEGQRRLADEGQWRLADDLVRACANELQRKVRADDVLGRFDDSRFVLLLRRVDTELAELIVKQAMTRLQAVCQDRSRWGGDVQVRAGLVGTGLRRPTLEEMLSEALHHAHRARREGVGIVTDMGSPVGATA